MLPYFDVHVANNSAGVPASGGAAVFETPRLLTMMRASLIRQSWLNPTTQPVASRIQIAEHALLSVPVATHPNKSVSESLEKNLFKIVSVISPVKVLIKCGLKTKEIQPEQAH